MKWIDGVIPVRDDDGAERISCPACGKVHGEITILTAEDFETDRHCSYVIELMGIERDVVRPILDKVGITEVGRDTVRSLAVMVYDWSKYGLSEGS